MNASIFDLVTVKPLGWVQNGTVHRANSYAGIEYEIEEVGAGVKLTTRVRGKDRIDFFSMLEAAKAFAQANFDARILSAIAAIAEPAKAPPPPRPWPHLGIDDEGGVPNPERDF